MKAKQETVRCQTESKIQVQLLYSTLDGNGEESGQQQSRTTQQTEVTL